MKTILYIITQSEFGGAQRFIFNMAVGLNPQKYEAVVAAGPEGDNESGLLRALEERGVGTVHLRHLKRELGLFTEILAFLEIKKLIKQLKPAVVQLGSSKAGIVGSLAAHFSQHQGRPKIIYRIGGFAFIQENSWLKRKIYLWAEKIAQRYRDVLVVNSLYEKKIATKMGLPQPEKIHVIYNGLNLQELTFIDRRTARTVLEKLVRQPLSAKKTIGTVAHFYPAKDLITLVRAAKIVVGSLPEARFVVVGDGREKARVTAEIKKLGLQKKVLLPGSIVPATPHIGAFDIFALSSRKEGSPWTILEAMAAGLPIVSTNVAGIPELIADQKNGFLVPPDRPDLLAEKIIYLLQRPAVAERFGAQNLTDIQKFTLPRMLAKFEKLYQ